MKNKRRQTRGAATSAGLEDGGGDGTSSPEHVAGSLIYIKLHGNSWWPAQVVDENCVSDARKPAARSPGEVLVRIYGSQRYAYADAPKCLREFETVVEQNNGGYQDLFQRALEQDLPSSKSSGSKGGGPKRRGAAKTTAGTSKVVRSEGRITQKKLDVEYTPGRQSADATAKTKAKRLYGTSREDEQSGPSDVPAFMWPVDSEQGSPSRRSRSASEKAKAKIYDQANIEDELSDEGTATSDDSEGKQKSHTPRGKKKSKGKRSMQEMTWVPDSKSPKLSSP